MKPRNRALHIPSWLWTRQQGIGVDIGILASKPLRSVISAVQCFSTRIPETVRAYSHMPALLEEKMNSSRSAMSLGRSKANIKARQGTIHVVAKHRNGMDISCAASVFSDNRCCSSSSTSDFDIDERDRMDYYKPSSALFSSFCNDIVARYKLGNVVQQAEVRSLRYGHVQDVPIDDRIFSVETSNGTKYARIVILALGPGGKPFLPRQLSSVEHEGACHSSQMTPKDNVPTHVMDKIRKRRPTNVAVVGGGLTSSQVVDLLVQKGVQKVWYIMRSGLKGQSSFVPCIMAFTRTSLTQHYSQRFRS